MATIAKAKAVCKTFPAATFDVKWGKDQVYSVAGKMFAVMCDQPKDAPSISFKARSNTST